MTLPTMVSEVDRATTLAWCRRIDEGPFATLAAGERIAFPNQECLVALAAAAAVTERVRIAATVFILPMHAPAWLAKQVATLDVLSRGRFVLGVGAGGREEDYRSVGAPFERRHQRVAEQVALLRRIWSGEPPAPGANPVGPRPFQPGGPPILAGAMAEAAIRRAAGYADGLAGFSLGPDAAEVETAFRVARDAWRDAGRPAPRLVTSFWYALGPGAREQMDTYVARYMGIYGASVVDSAQRQTVATSTVAVREALQRIADLGADEVILVPTSAERDQLERLLDAIG